MEEGKHDAAFSWWSDSHNLPGHSQWLRATLSDLDKKTKMMVNLIQVDGDSFADRVEMFYDRSRPQLLKLLQGLHHSYGCLAENYDRVLSECSRIAHPRSLWNVAATDAGASYKQPLPNRPDEGEDRLVPEEDNFRLQTQLSIRELKEEEEEEEEKMWNEMRVKVWKLLEDNLRQQAELIRRNEEKREMIKRLGARIGRLMEENRALKKCVPRYKGETELEEEKQWCMSKLKGLNCIGN